MLRASGDISPIAVFQIYMQTDNTSRPFLVPYDPASLSKIGIGVHSGRHVTTQTAEWYSNPSILLSVSDAETKAWLPKSKAALMHALTILNI